jgi:hypothetical protein
MNNIEKLHLYLQEAIRRTTAKEYRKVSDALIPVLPDLVKALSQVIADSTATPAQRLQAADMLIALWGRCLREEDRERKHLTNLGRLKVQRTKVEADDRQSKLAIAAERRKIDATLTKARKEIGG